MGKTSAGIAIAGIALASCNAAAVPGGDCGAAIFSQPRLAIPASGAIGVPAGIGAIVVGQDETGGKFYLQASGHAPFPIGPVFAVPSPAPSALPTYDPVSYFREVAVPPLTPATQYTVTYASPDGNQPCPKQVSGTVGTFATQ